MLIIFRDSKQQKSKTRSIMICSRSRGCIPFRLACRLRLSRITYRKRRESSSTMKATQFWGRRQLQALKRLCFTLSLYRKALSFTGPSPMEIQHHFHQMFPESISSETRGSTPSRRGRENSRGSSRIFVVKLESPSRILSLTTTSKGGAFRWIDTSTL